MGGLSKKAYQIAEITKTKSQPALLLDGGSLLFKTKPVAQGQQNQDRLTAEAIVKAYNLMGYNAVGVSSDDLAGGLDVLLEIKEKSQFDWLSCNIINKTNGKLLFKPAISRQVGDIRIGVVGLTNQLPPESQLLGKETEIRAWRETLPKVIGEMAREHDFIILLTSLPAREYLAIAKEYPAINLIINAKRDDANHPPQNLTESTTLVSTGQKGKYIGVMKVLWYQGSKWQTENLTLLDIKKDEQNRLNRQLSLLKDRPELRSNYQKLQRQLRTIETTIEKIEKEHQFSDKKASPRSTHKNTFMAMEKSLPDHSAVLAIVNATKRKIAESTKKMAATASNDNLTNRGFTGWQRCRSCHSKQVNNWQKTRHASSFQTLIKKKQQLNLNCLPCHVTGVALNYPAAAIGMPAQLQMVSCESCHGPGALHSDSPVSNKLKPVTEKICLGCHVPEHDESFNFNGDIKKLNCIP